MAATNEGVVGPGVNARHAAFVERLVSSTHLSSTFSQGQHLPLPVLYCTFLSVALMKWHCGRPRLTGGLAGPVPSPLSFSFPPLPAAVFAVSRLL